MSIKRHVFSYTLYSGVSIYVESFVGLLISILIARQLGAEELGVYSLMLWFSMMGVAVANGGLKIAVIKFLAQARGAAEAPSTHSILAYVFRLQIILLPIAIMVAFLVAYLMVGRVVDEKYTFLLIAIVLAIAPKAMQIFYLSVIKGHEAFKSIFLVNVIVTPINLFIVVVIILLGGGIREFVWAYLLVTILYFIVTWHFTKKITKTELDFTALPPEYQSRMNQFIKIATLNAFFVFIIDYGMEVVFLNWLASPADAGFYTIGFRLAESVVTMVPGVFGFVLLPIMARSMGEGVEILIHRFRESGRFLVITASPFMAFGVVFADLIVETLYGSDLAQAAMPLRVLLLFFSFTMLNGLTTSILLSMDRQRALLKIMVVTAIANVAADAVLIYYFALTGAVAASVLIKVGFTIACHLLVTKMLRTSLPYFEYIKIFALSYVLLLPVFLLHQATASFWIVVVGGLGYFLLYFFLMMFQFKLTRDEVSIVHSYAQKIPVIRFIFHQRLYAWIDARYAAQQPSA